MAYNFITMQVRYLMVIFVMKEINISKYKFAWTNYKYLAEKGEYNI